MSGTQTPVAVITGLGVVAPNGLGIEDYWSATLRGESGIRQQTRFNSPDHPLQLAGQVQNFDPEKLLPSRMLPQTDPTTQYALVASEWAMQDAALTAEDLDPLTSSVVTASASGGFEFGQRELQHLWRDGAAHVSVYMSFAWFYAVNSGQLSIRHNLRGPSGVLVSEQAGALDALGQSRRLVRQGMSVVLTGGTDASLCPFGWAAHAASGACVDTRGPNRGYRPFDALAQGHIPGEGGAILVVEDEEHARQRGATVQARVAGYAATFEPGPVPAEPSAVLRAARQAIADAGLQPADIDLVFADAAADPAADRAESAALRTLFGAYGVPVTAPKVLTGRLFSGAALDVATAVRSIRDNVVPHTPFAEPAPEHELDLVLDQPRQTSVDAVLVLARGAGGFHSAAVLTR